MEIEEGVIGRGRQAEADNTLRDLHKTESLNFDMPHEGPHEP